MTNTIRIRGHHTGWTGYGQIGEWLGRGLEARGHRIEFEDYGADLRWLPQQDYVRSRITGKPHDGWVIHLATPNHMFDRSNPTVFFTMWETDGLPRASADFINTAQAVVVPSAYNVETFRQNGVMVPIYQCPLGVSAGEGYLPCALPPGPITFGMAGRLAGGGGTRKGVIEGIWAWIEAFPDDDVRLEVKVCPDCYPILASTLPRDERINIDTTVMRPHEMAQWYRKIHCLFVPSRGEGWGLHTHQAMVMGRPIIATNHGGTAELFGPRCGWELEYDVMPATGYYFGQGKWAVPTHNSMVEQLRAAASNRLELAYRGDNAARFVAPLTWKATAARMEEILVDVGAIARREAVA